jgi:hypothetical protein|tara:strand:+ start:86 stop:442 length:357 start_codon:yes stop_codon:yes gene_type:complete
MEKKWGRGEEMLKALAELGPMTSVEICHNIGTTKQKSGAILGRLMRAGVTKPKRIYICGWTHDAEGARRYPRAIYALGDKKDKPAPRPSPAENQRRYKAKKSKMVNSVFQLGTPIKYR